MLCLELSDKGAPWKIGQQSVIGSKIVRGSFPEMTNEWGPNERVEFGQDRIWDAKMGQNELSNRNEFSRNNYTERLQVVTPEN